MTYYTLIVFSTLSVVWRTVNMFGMPVGPYKLKVLQLKSCTDEGTGQIHFSSKISRSEDGRHVYNEEFRLLLNENTKVDFKVHNWGNGGYKPHFIEYTAKNCEDAFKYLKDFFIGLLKSAGVNITKCPIPEGNYTARNFNVDETKFNNVPAITYNKYKMIATFYNKEVKVGCVIIYVEAVPI